MPMRLILLFGIFTGVFIYYVCTEEIISEGVWRAVSLEECPEKGLPITLRVKKFKFNRTHDCFNMSAVIDKEINTYNSGVQVEVCKKLDGGCKLQTIYYVISFCNMLNKYAKENFVKILTAAGIEPANCPIPKGEYFVENLYFDYEELPGKSLLGEFSGKVQLMRHGRAVCCAIINYVFEKKVEDDEEEQ